MLLNKKKELHTLATTPYETETFCLRATDDNTKQNVT